MVTKIKLDERRRFERLAMPDEADVRIYSATGSLVGKMTVLGRGGMSVDTKQKFVLGEIVELVIQDASEGIRRPVKVMVRDVGNHAAGFQFDDLDPDAAVEIGVIIGKYYSAHTGKK